MISRREERSPDLTLIFTSSWCARLPSSSAVTAGVTPALPTVTMGFKL
jgi:hypothetical protein